MSTGCYPTEKLGGNFTKVAQAVPGLGDLAAIVFQIIAAVKANGGEYYRYPWALRLIK